jgi:hypothetical protein
MQYSVVFLLFAFVAQISGHARLVIPAAYNPNPSQAAPCGVSSITSAMASTAQATWLDDQNVTITWDLIAADGGGNLLGFFDPLGGTDFSVPAWSFAFPTSGSNKIYNVTFTIPGGLNCSKSPTGLCTFQVHSNTWFSCSTVKICTSNCPVPTQPPASCKAVTTPLAFCPSVAGVELAAAYDPSDIDQDVASTYTANLANPGVFTTPNNSNCQALYKSFICSLNMPPCNPQTGVADSSGRACQSQCSQTMKTCGLTPGEQNLYNCNNLPLCNGQSTKSGGMSPGGAAALSIFIIGSAATLGAFGYIYHKKGQLFGYRYDKDSHKIVKVPANPHNYTTFVDPEYKM